MDYRYNHKHSSVSLYEQLMAIPKIELHRHLEGSLRLETMAEVAREYDIELPGHNIEDFRSLVQITPDDDTTSEAFLSKFKTLRLFFRSREVIERVAYEVVADAAEENVVYLELRFTPMALASESGHSLTEVVDWTMEAVKRASTDYNLPVSLIMGMNRHEPPAVGEWAVEIAIERIKDGIVAVDLMGNEAQYKAGPFKHVFDRAHEGGLWVTAHGGEWAGPESAIESVEVLGAQRLGHGIHLIENQEKFHAICKQGVYFEVCPTSNVQSGAAPSIGEHPLREMYRLYPHLMTINTDDPSISGLNLTDELVTAIEDLGMTLEDVQHMMINAARAAFLPEDRRTELVSKMERAFSEEKQQPTPKQSG